MYTAKITADDPELLERVFNADSKSLRDRSSCDIKRNKGKLEFSIQANDAAALRQEFNSIMKMLTVIEKMGEI